MVDNLMGQRWEDAPEGTTHILNGIWRKVEGPEVKYWNGVEWKLHHRGMGPEEFIARFDPEPRPVALLPIVVINGVEVDWNEAPEGTTHASTNHVSIAQYGQWRKVKGQSVFDWSYKRGEWVVRDWLNAKDWLNANDYAIVKHPNLIAVEPVKAEPVKAATAATIKKQVGWWS